MNLLWKNNTGLQVNVLREYFVSLKYSQLHVSSSEMLIYPLNNNNKQMLDKQQDKTKYVCCIYTSIIHCNTVVLHAVPGVSLVYAQYCSSLDQYRSLRRHTCRNWICVCNT